MPFPEPHDDYPEPALAGVLPSALFSNSLKISIVIIFDYKI
jgi:hypothetical protein